MSYPRISLIHITGNPNSRNCAMALSEIGCLQKIITTIAYNPESPWADYLNFLPEPIRKPLVHELGRRTWIAPQGASIYLYPWQEILRVSLVRTGLGRRLGFGSQGPIEWVYASLDDYVAKHHLQGIDAIYAYEDGAATTFHAAKQQGILCLYELPILFYRMSRDIQYEERQRFPELASALEGIQDSARKIERKEQEIQLADHIFVPSSFVQSSLLSAGVKPEKVSVIPYGAPIDYFRPQTKPSQGFCALFVGRVGPRKGVHYLLQAWQKLQLPDAQLLLIGINEFPERWLAQYTDVFRYIPSVPHKLLNEYYSAADVLVLPSLVEGFPLVLLEAMACGIPVITTPNAGGYDFLTDGVEGFVVPVRDVETLQEKLEWCYRHPQELLEMGQAARRKAEQLNWNLYRQKMGNRIREIWQDHNRN